MEPETAAGAWPESVMMRYYPRKGIGPEASREACICGSGQNGSDRAIPEHAETWARYAEGKVGSDVVFDMIGLFAPGTRESSTRNTLAILEKFGRFL